MKTEDIEVDFTDDNYLCKNPYCDEEFDVNIVGKNDEDVVLTPNVCKCEQLVEFEYLDNMIDHEQQLVEAEHQEMLMDMQKEERACHE